MLYTLERGAQVITCSFITDADGEAYEFINYLPCGELMAEQSTESFGTPYKFNGKELDEETGLYDYGARYYDPSLSLWMSVDPLAEKYAAWSQYTYTYNNPINFIDPDGRSNESIHEDANGIEIARYDDGDNNVYRHNELGNEGQHVDGMKAIVDQKRDMDGNTSGGGEKQVLASVVNSISESPLIQSIMPKSIEFEGNASLSLDAGLIYKRDFGARGTTLSGPTVNLLKWDFDPTAGHNLYTPGQNGEFRGKIFGGQVESLRGDIKGGMKWNNMSGIQSYGGVGKPMFEMKYSKGALYIGVQEDWGSSFGYLKMLGGAVKADIRGQFKIQF